MQLSEEFSDHWKSTVDVIHFKLTEQHAQNKLLTCEVVASIVQREVKDIRWLSTHVPHQFQTWLFNFTRTYPEAGAKLKAEIQALTIAYGASESTVKLGLGIGVVSGIAGIISFFMSKTWTSTGLLLAGGIIATGSYFTALANNQNVIGEVCNYLLKAGDEFKKIVNEAERQ